MLLFSSIVLETPVSALKKNAHSCLNANAAVTTVLENSWSVLGF